MTQLPRTNLKTPTTSHANLYVKNGTNLTNNSDNNKKPSVPRQRRSYTRPTTQPLKSYQAHVGRKRQNLSSCLTNSSHNSSLLPKQTEKRMFDSFNPPSLPPTHTSGPLGGGTGLVMATLGPPGARGSN